MSKPLSKKQKARIAQLAARAYRVMVTCGCPADSLDIWRRDQQREVTGFESLTEMNQRHYVPLCNHFLTISGGSKMTDRTWTDRDKALHRLRDMMARHELTNGYLWSIISDQFRIRIQGYKPEDMWDVLKTKFTPEDIIRLSYTLNNRGRSKTIALDIDHNIDPDQITEPHAHPSTIPPGGLADLFNTEKL